MQTAATKVSGRKRPVSLHWQLWAQQRSHTRAQCTAAAPHNPSHAGIVLPLPHLTACSHYQRRMHVLKASSAAAKWLLHHLSSLSLTPLSPSSSFASHMRPRDPAECMQRQQQPVSKQFCTGPVCTSSTSHSLSASFCLAAVQNSEGRHPTAQAALCP